MCCYKSESCDLFGVLCLRSFCWVVGFAMLVLIFYGVDFRCFFEILLRFLVFMRWVFFCDGVGGRKDIGWEGFWEGVYLVSSF